MKYLVTGGAGFIGSHIVEYILSQNHEVIVVDNLSTGKIENLPNNARLSFIHKDINRCTAKDFTQGIDGVIHLSASPSVKDSWLNAKTTHNNNLTSTISIVELCRSLGIKKVVFASSAAVYGNIKKIPISETEVSFAISPYGLHKRFSEEYLSIYSQKLDTSVIALRFFNVFGPRQDPNSQYSGVISKFVQLMRTNEQITIFGTGEQTRDFVFVKDVARACYLALIQPNDKQFMVINIGTGHSTSINQLVEKLTSIFPKWNKGIIYSQPNEGDILHSVADTSRATSLLGFSSQYLLERGLIEFEESQFGAK